MSHIAHSFYEHDSDGSAIRVAINEGGFMYAQDKLSIFIGQRMGHDGTRVLHFTADGTMQWTDVAPLEACQASMEIPRDFAYALMGALVRHFEGASDARQMRLDLLHERGRVDRMLEHVLAMARQSLDKLPDGTDL
jgi:hypothetical protein